MMPLWLASATVAAAVAASPAFDPPLARDAQYETEQARQVRGSTQRFRMVNRLSFARDAGGWRLALTLVDLSTDAPADSAALFDAAMRPFIGVPILMRLEPDGRPAETLNSEEAWSAIAASIAPLEQRIAARPDGAAAAGFLRAFAGLAGPAREARLLATADPLIGFDLPPLRIGESAPWTGQPAAGATVSGTITRQDAPGDALSYRIVTRTRPPGQSLALDEERDLRIDSATGLLLEARAIRRVGQTIVVEERIRRLR